MPHSVISLRSIGLALAFLLTVSAVRADNWERFRGPNGDGVSNDKNIPVKFSATENLRWKATIPGDGHSSPVIWGDRLFLQTSALDGSDRSLLCLDTKTGKEIWKRSIPATKVKFRYDSSHASATPTTDGESIFVPYWDGKDIILVAYNFKGDKLWDRNLGEFVSQHGAGASPILYKDLVIFSMDKDAFREVAGKKGEKAGAKKKEPVANPSTLYALDKKTGKTVWETPREAIRACYSVPFVLEKPGASPELIVTSTTAITGYDLTNGKPNWYFTWSFPKDPLRTIAATSYSNGVLLACSGDGSGDRYMVALELKGAGKSVRAEQIWDNKKQFPYVTCPIIKGEHVYFVNDLGAAGCFHAKTGNKVWFERMSDAKFYASPVMIDGKLYAASEQGDVYVIAADTKYELLAKNALGERIRATPAVADGTLYIRGQNTLFAIGKK